jgi:hypothetical protein
VARTVKDHLGEVLARRRLREVGGKRRWLTVSLGRPRQSGADEWFCPYHFSQIVRPAMGRAYGIDAFQALIMGLEAIKHRLDGAGCFALNDWEAGDTGFYRFVPTNMNGRFTRQFERLLDRAVNKAARDGIRLLDRREARARRRKKNAR